ncbi:MAG: cyclic nucleotide-binding domain-containing protein [Magnetococcales bacterium]|nr:cyclic nucleotide-binding domain-containing protein [Magnetococcales bacterium]
MMTLLQEISFFWEFTPEERKLISENDSFFSTFQPGAFLIRQDATDRALFVLIRGSANVTLNAHPETVLATLEQGAIIGEMSFLSHQPRATNVIAKETVTAFQIDSEAMDQMDPSLQLKIQNQLIKILIDRLEETNGNLMRQKEQNMALVEALRDKFQ